MYPINNPIVSYWYNYGKIWQHKECQPGEFGLRSPDHREINSVKAPTSIVARVFACWELSWNSPHLRS